MVNIKKLECKKIETKGQKYISNNWNIIIKIWLTYIHRLMISKIFVGFIWQDTLYQRIKETIFASHLRVVTMDCKVISQKDLYYTKYWLVKKEWMNTIRL